VFLAANPTEAFFPLFGGSWNATEWLWLNGKATVLHALNVQSTSTDQHISCCGRRSAVYRWRRVLQPTWSQPERSDIQST